VPSTDEVWRLQRGSDPECLFFQEMAEHGHYGGRPGTTRQGIYVCSPNGKFLASINSNRADRVLAMMERGLAAWQALPAEERHAADNAQFKPEHRWEDSFPADGLVLTQTTRDLPLVCTPDAPCEVKWNQDHAWFSKSEARAWLGDDLNVGAMHEVPWEIVGRLARLHFVDSVKGQTSRFSERGVAGSAIQTQVVERADNLVKLKITGSTRGESSGLGRRESAHGVVTRLLGHATYDLTREAFVEFEMVALGRRWGHTTNNSRRRDAESGPLGYVFRLASPDAPRIAPAFIASYDVDWVRRP
jgi:hypothetical protein